MPIPPPERYIKSNLTREQREEQLAIVYGVTVNQLSHEEIERMRQIVQQHDGERKPMQIVDLNNPPKEPYRFQEFPMMVYDLTHSAPGHVVSKLVHSEVELQASLEKGWTKQAPAFSDERIEPLSASYQAEASRIDRQIEAANQAKRGRARQAEVA